MMLGREIFWKLVSYESFRANLKECGDLQCNHKRCRERCSRELGGEGIHTCNGCLMQIRQVLTTKFPDSAIPQ